MTPACTNEAINLWPLFWIAVVVAWAYVETHKPKDRDQ